MLIDVMAKYKLDQKNEILEKMRKGQKFLDNGNLTPVQIYNYKLDICRIDSKLQYCIEHELNFYKNAQEELNLLNSQENDLGEYRKKLISIVFGHQFYQMLYHLSLGYSRSERITRHECSDIKLEGKYNRVKQ